MQPRPSNMQYAYFSEEAESMKKLSCSLRINFERT